MKLLKQIIKAFEERIQILKEMRECNKRMLKILKEKPVNNDIYQMAFGNHTLEQLIAAADPKRPDELSDALDIANREDDLKELTKHPIFGVEAQKDLQRREWMAGQDKRWQERVAKYPEPIKTLNAILRSKDFRPGLGIMAISYPSVQAVQHDMGDNYFAVSGDGLFLYLIEVVSLEGEGKFKIAPDPPFKSTPYYKRENPNRYLNRDRTKCKVGDVFNSEQLIELFTGLYGDYREDEGKCQDEK